jgi:hypothetical protein
LPKPVRENIYRLCLIADEQPVDFEAYQKTCGYTKICKDWVRRSDKSQDLPTRPAKRKMPHLLQVSRKMEREASHIYFGENTFGLWTPESLTVWKHFTRPRHINRIRKVQLLHWTRLQGVGGDEAFEGLSTLPRLESLTFVVNEAQQLENLLAPWRYEYQYESVHRAIRWDTSLGFGPQIGLQTLRVTGIVGLRSLRGLREVNFRGTNGLDHQGSVSGGFLETTIKSEITQSRRSKSAA